MFLGKIRRLLPGLALKVSCVKATTSEAATTPTPHDAMFISDSAAPQLRTWLGGRMEVKYVLGSQEAISEAGRLGGCRL